MSMAFFKIWLARWAVWWERCWAAAWPAVAVAALFVAVALFDLLPLLPGWLHLAILIAFAAALLYGSRNFWSSLRFPQREDGIRRLERVNRLAHRPLTALDDFLVTSANDPIAAGLWEKYRRRLVRGLGRLRIGTPRSGIIERDPYALRVLLGALLAVAVVGAWSEALERLQRAVLPNLASIAAEGPIDFTLSLTPPAYTGAPPIFIEATDGAEMVEPLRLPIGTAVLALVQGPAEPPEFRLGATATRFTAVEPRTYQIKSEIRAGDSLAIVSQGIPLATWPIDIVPDSPPTVAFVDPPGPGERRALRLAYTATDDYGVVSVTGTIRRADGQSGPLSLQQIDLNLPLPGVDPRQAKQVSYHDLTPHPWAGLPVKIELTVRDAIGQTGVSETVEIVLPGRIFSHPVARAIIEERKRLIVDPMSRMAVSRQLHAIGAQPPTYNDDLVVLLGLRIAQRRLMYDRGEAAIDSVQRLLWELALSIEDGELSVAEREMRALQEALQQALANGASDEEIERLMDELQKAMDRFMQELAEQMQREMQQAGPRGQQLPDPNMMELRREDLQKMLERARELARGGAREAARDMLAQMQEMLENLQAMPRQGEMDPAMAEAMDMLEDMDNLAQRQQDLMDQTFRRSQQMQPGGQMPGGDPGAAEQEALRRDLGEMMRRYGELMGDIPRSLGRAERSMRDATQALNQGMPGEAVAPQGEALSGLQQGLRDMAEAMMEQLQMQAGPRQGQDQLGQSRDPLGRNEDGIGMFDTSNVDLPADADVQRAKQLIDELRQRAGDRQRPKLERDYIERLLKRF